MTRGISTLAPSSNRRTLLKFGAAFGMILTAEKLRAQNTSPITVAAVFSFPLHEPWVSRVHDALNNAQSQGHIKYVCTENVKGKAYTNALQGYAKQGVQLIISEAFDNTDAIYKLAKNYPKIAFLVGSTGRPQQPNLSVFDNHIHEPTYLAGMIAGGMSQTGIISLVAGHPVPKTNRLLHAFIDGALEINPDAKFTTAFINSWSDPIKTQQVALHHIQQGADIIYAERAGVEDIAQQHKKLVINNTISTHSSYPETVLVSAVWDASPAIARALTMVERGMFKADDYGKYAHLRYQGSMLQPEDALKKKIPKALLARVNARRQTILDGSFILKLNDAPISPLS
jgi:basic membrane protein A